MVNATLMSRRVPDKRVSKAVGDVHSIHYLEVNKVLMDGRSLTTQEREVKTVVMFKRFKDDECRSEFKKKVMGSLIGAKADKVGRRRMRMEDFHGGFNEMHSECMWGIETE